ncbi:MAG: hypothetical protein KAQ68_11580 [Clostridiales bacterium]|nr:hypothetical protein [Clostridiales bacterium]
MSELQIICPNCSSSIQENTLECVGIDEMDFVPKSDGVKLGFELKLGSINIAKGKAFHGTISNTYLCTECKKIVAIFDIEQ